MIAKPAIRNTMQIRKSLCTPFLSAAERGWPTRLRLGMLAVLWVAFGFLGPSVLASTVVAWGESDRLPGSPPSMTTNVPVGLFDAVAVAGALDVGFALRAN